MNSINKQDADLVLIAGDIFDNEWEAVDQPEELEKILWGIKSKYGVYACYGNHDIQEQVLAGFTFGGQREKTSSPEMDEFMEKAGITLLPYISMAAAMPTDREMEPQTEHLRTRSRKIWTNQSPS